MRRKFTFIVGLVSLVGIVVFGIWFFYESIREHELKMGTASPGGATTPPTNRLAS